MSLILTRKSRNSNRKLTADFLFLAVFIFEGCMFMAHTLEFPEKTSDTDICSKRNLIEIQSDYGHIDSEDIHLNSKHDCQIWRIQARPNTTITISFTKLLNGNIHHGNCDGKSRILLGPAPELTLCGHTEYHSNAQRVYHSKRDHVWIKFILEEEEDRFYYWYTPQFHLDFISSASEHCEWRCLDRTCVLKKWRCNGVKECSDGSDELLCSNSVRTSPSPKPTSRSLPTTRLPATIKHTNGWLGATRAPSLTKESYNDYCNMHCTLKSTGRYACLSKYRRCNGVVDCQYGEDEITCSDLVKATTKKPGGTCEYEEIFCYVIHYKRSMCLHNMHKCDGVVDCWNGEDEDQSMCGANLCNKRLENPVGWIASPNFPMLYPINIHCSWVIHKQGAAPDSTIQLRLKFFSLEDLPNTDYLSIYDGPDTTYPLIGTFYGAKRPPYIIESKSNWLNVIFNSNNINEFKGFNLTYNIKGVCLPNQGKCPGEEGCYDRSAACNGKWDCAGKGGDELGCGHCKPTEYSCGLVTDQCYHPTERCNGIARCTNGADENNCTSRQCGTNGTFLCDNNHCIYETWICDQRDDCGDNSDEKNCTGSTRRVIIAAISGSMICALLLVILLGCSCKLYSLRTADRYGGARHETPLSRQYAEMLRRRAPPPYHEAMLTSRNFDEVQQEIQEGMRNNSRRSRRSGNRRRSSRSNNNQNQTDSGMANNSNSNANELVDTATNSNSDNINHTRDTVTLLTAQNVNESQQTVSMGNTENRNNVNIDRQSSTTELIPLESDNESEDSNADLENQCQEDISVEDQINDDDENILVSGSLSARWSRSVVDDDSSDDICILEETDFHGFDDPLSVPMDLLLEQGHCDNVSTDTASASIDNISLDILETETTDTLIKLDEEQNSDSSNEDGEDSRNSTPKPETCSFHGNTTVISMSQNCQRIGGSQGSLNSVGSETYSEHEVPLLVLNSSS